MNFCVQRLVNCLCLMRPTPPVFVRGRLLCIFVKSRIFHEECTGEFSKCRPNPCRPAFVKIPVHDEWSSRLYKNTQELTEDEYGGQFRYANN